MKKETNRTKNIKLTVLSLFVILIVLWIVVSVVFIFVYANLNDMPMEETLKILTSLPFILYLCTVFLVGTLILCKIILTIRILNNYVVLDSDEINKMIAKSTAPFREKYYLIYNATKQKDNIIILLRKQLEKLQTKIKK